jgi:hypothetical protein
MSQKNQRTSKDRKIGPTVLANRDGLEMEIRSWIDGRFDGRPCCFVCVSDGAVPGQQVFDIGEQEFSRALIVIERDGSPISAELVQAWRDWAMSRDVWELRMAVVNELLGKDSFDSILIDRCADWDVAPPEAERAAITPGQFVTLPDGGTPKDDPSLLTMMFGSMGDLLTQLEIVAKRFRTACIAAKFDKNKRKKIRDEATKRMAVDTPKDEELRAFETGLENMIDHFPKILLYGETGVGKTLIASYLQARASMETETGRPLRVPIPEYLGKEESFEYDLFGYAAGTYTGGRPDGSPGKLISHVGGVIFLDEIGEANLTIQSKLLAFLDDYRVSPRGWDGEKFHCPVLIVAATNKNLDEEVADKQFKGDLLARFTDRFTIPPLRERMVDIEFILDCLLQRESLNPDGYVTEIGTGALEAIRKRRFKDGNFRELEDWFRSVCAEARREGRNYLVAGDVPPPEHVGM